MGKLHKNLWGLDEHTLDTIFVGEGSAIWVKAHQLSYLLLNHNTWWDSINQAIGPFAWKSFLELHTWKFTCYTWENIWDTEKNCSNQNTCQNHECTKRKWNCERFFKLTNFRSWYKLSIKGFHFFFIGSIKGFHEHQNIFTLLKSLKHVLQSCTHLCVCVCREREKEGMKGNTI